jgi:hypothetical protein
MIKLERSVQIDALLGQLNELKKKLSGGADLTREKPVSGSGEAGAEVRVVGQVNAGRLKESLAMVPGIDGKGQVFNPASQGSDDTTKLQRREGSPQRITVEQAYEQWQQWVGEVRSKKIGIGTILAESRILDVSDGILRIACPDDYHVSSLNRHKEFLVDCFLRVAGLKILIEPVTHGATETVQSPVPASAPSRSNTENQPPQAPKNGKGGNRDHPVILALRRELGAEPIE